MNPTKKDSPLENYINTQRETTSAILEYFKDESKINAVLDIFEVSEPNRPDAKADLQERRSEWNEVLPESVMENYFRNHIIEETKQDMIAYELKQTLQKTPITSIVLDHLNDDDTSDIIMNAQQPSIFEDKGLSSWFQGLDFIEMERIAGFKQYDFSDDGGYQEFVDTCEAYWKDLSIEDKIEHYKEIGPNGFDLSEIVNQRHFEFTGDTKVITRECFNLDGSLEIRDITLHRIRLTEEIENGDDLLFVGDIGGWIEKPENIEGSGWVSDEAMVYHNACVCDRSIASGNAEIKDSAITADDSLVGENAVISHQGYIGDDAYVGENAIVSENAKIEECAEITGHARICDNSEVRGEGCIGDNVIIQGNSIVTEKVTIIDNVIISDNAVVAGKCMIEGNVKITDFSRVENSDLSDDVLIQGKAIVRDSNLSFDTVIDGNAIIEKCVLEYGVFNESKTYKSINHQEEAYARIAQRTQQNVNEDKTQKAGQREEIFVGDKILGTKQLLELLQKRELTVKNVTVNGRKCNAVLKMDENNNIEKQFHPQKTKQVTKSSKSKPKQIKKSNRI
jgi:carbonic anhydrase/acetyltransferase-like protein (isoleucine patch superfamily)